MEIADEFRQMKGIDVTFASLEAKCHSSRIICVSEKSAQVLSRKVGRSLEFRSVCKTRSFAVQIRLHNKSVKNKKGERELVRCYFTCVEEEEVCMTR